LAHHPADLLLSIAWLFPQPGTKTPSAEIRYLPVTLNGESVWRFRAVTYDEPRKLIGYYPTLEDAAMASHRRAVANVGGAALSDADAYKTKA
jgi:hypothetical protein